MNDIKKKRVFTQVFANDFVKKLTLVAPCDFNVHLKMSRLEEVVVDYPTPSLCNFNRCLQYPVGAK